MATRTRRGGTRAPSGTATMTITGAGAADDDGAASNLPAGIIRLQPQRHVDWVDGTVDNEHLGRKSSKCARFFFLFLLLLLL
jgi:hypothetical protein